MGLFDKLKNKAKEIANSIEETSAEKEVSKEEVYEEVHEEGLEKWEIYENEYEYSDKEAAGVPYPHGWESLGELEIADKLDKFFKKLNKADDDEDKELAVLTKFGFKNIEHYELFRKAVIQERADKEGVSTTQALLNQDKERTAAAVDAAVASDREDLQPVDGVSIELWAKAVAYSANSGGDQAGTLEIMGKDQAGFDKVCHEWNTRMANDTTYTIMQIYGAAFTAASTAGKPEITEESFPYKKYVKVSKALELLSEQGKDAQEILNMLAMFWSKKYNSDIEKYRPLAKKYEKKYEKKYAAGDSSSDIEF